MNGRRITRIGTVISNFPVKMIEISGAYNEDENDNIMRILNREGILKEFSIITTREWIISVLVCKSANKGTKELYLAVTALVILINFFQDRSKQVFKD